MLNKAAICAICLLLQVSAAAQAQVYEWLDKQGRHHYSDREQDRARILAVQPANDAYHFVEKVFDGDTVLLGDGQKVRLLGINTPEVAGRNKAAESGGEEARAWLRQRLTHRKVRLESDVESRDKYGRTLAYVFTEDKQHINLELVRQGLAFVNIYPPNLKYVDRLLAAQQEAERAGLGIWRDPEYAPTQAVRLNATNYRGWKRVTGRVLGLKKTVKYSYLQFSDHVAVRIENKILAALPPLSGYVGKNVEARGWVAKSKDRFIVPVRHPGDMKMLSAWER
ncbi:MAG: thermonuclease family protein [Methylomonas sp.]|nr:thermonuclease family protein [Methylomonas sp.]